MSEGSIDDETLTGLAELLAKRVGLKITPDGFYGLRLALKARMPEVGLTDAKAYLAVLQREEGHQEFRALLPLVTVGKTDFFRDPGQFRALEQTMLPQLLARARAEFRPLRIWSAGCATGEEPYSLAMLALELGARPTELELHATDVNPRAVETAARGVFALRKMGGLSRARIERFFTLTPAGYAVAPEVKSAVQFSQHNLASADPPGGVRTPFDLILCRNVIIYFDRETIRVLLERFFESLRPGGVLLLGYSESLMSLDTRFERYDVDGAIAWRRAFPGTERAAPGKPSSVPRPSRPAAAAIAPVAAPAPVATPVPALAPSKSSSVAASLARVSEALHRSEFERALREVRELARLDPAHLGAGLTYGNVLSLMGQHETARVEFARVLQQEPLCVEAHLYAALASIQCGDADTAKVELGRAIFLEPTLALAHYVKGLVLEREGAWQAAHRAYSQAFEEARSPQRELIGEFPDLPRGSEAVTQACKIRLGALAGIVRPSAPNPP